MKDILVMGSAGMAGHQIALYLMEQGYNVTGFSLKKNPFVEGYIGDATNTQFVKKIITDGHYDYVINCIGILNQFAEENHAAAVQLNSYLPHYLAWLTRNMHTRIIHMSTDCVFSGKRGSYKKDDFCDGETFYDRSKALGELRDEKNITLRNSIVGPDMNENGIGLLNWFMKQQGQANGYTASIWTGQTTLQLAKTMEYVMENDVIGLYNAVPKESITKFELLKLFNHYLRSDSLYIIPIEGVHLDKSLIATPINGGKYVIPSYEIMVREMSEWISNHIELYKHYRFYTATESLTGGGYSTPLSVKWIKKRRSIIVKKPSMPRDVMGLKGVSCKDNIVKENEVCRFGSTDAKPLKAKLLQMEHIRDKVTGWEELCG